MVTKDTAMATVMKAAKWWSDSGRVMVRTQVDNASNDGMNTGPKYMMIAEIYDDRGNI